MPDELLPGACHVTEQYRNNPIEADKGRFDYVHGGYKKWREKVESVRLADLTPDKIQAWKVEFLKKASSNPLAHKNALSTIASLIRTGKALFA